MVKILTSPVQGDVPFGGHKATGLADPTSAQDASTKAYVDAVAQGLSVKASVRAASTANIASQSGLLTVDGVTLVDGDRVLAKDQTTGSTNGIWVAHSSAWTRAADADAAAELVGAFVFVEEGATNAGSGWVQTAAAPITVGTTTLTWVQFSGAGQIVAGAGLAKSGNTLRRAASATGYANLAALPSAAANNGLLERTADGGIYESDGSAWQVVRDPSGTSAAAAAGVNDVRLGGAKCDAVKKTAGGAVGTAGTAFTGSGFTAAHVGRTIAIAGAGTANLATTTADVTFPASTIPLSAVTDTRLNTAGGMVVVGGHPVIYQAISGNNLTGCSGGVTGVTVTSGAAVTAPGPAGHVTTIAAYVSATQVTLTDPAPVAVTDAAYWHYHDDTAAIQAMADTVRAAGGGELVVSSGVVVVSFQSHPQNGAYKSCLILGSGTRLKIAPGATIVLAPFQAALNGANNSIVMNYNIAGASPQDSDIVVEGGTIDGNALYQPANFYSGVLFMRGRRCRAKGVTVKNVRGLTQSSSLLSGGETFFFSASLGAANRWDDCFAVVDQGVTVPGATIGSGAGGVTSGSNIFTTTAGAYPAGFTQADVGKWVQFNTAGAGSFLQAVVTQVDSATQCRLSVLSTVTTTAANWAMGAQCASGFSANTDTGPKWVNCLATGMTVNNGFTNNGCRGAEYDACSQWLSWNHGFNFETSPDTTATGCHSGGRAASSATGTPFTAGQNIGACIGHGFVFNGSTQGVLVGCNAQYNAGNGATTAGGGAFRIVGGVYSNNGQIGISQSAGGTIVIEGGPLVTGNSSWAVASSGWHSEVYRGVPTTGDGSGHTFPQPTGSGVAVVNPWPCTALVSMTGGSPSAAAIAASSGPTMEVDRSAAVPVLPGGSYTPTYTGTAPTLACMLV